MVEKSTKESSFEKITPILLIVTIILTFGVGILWQKVSTLEGGKADSLKADSLTEPVDVGQPSPDGKLTEEQAKNIAPISDDDHIKGSKDAKIILIEYSDLECPYCSTFHLTAEQAKEEYGDDIAWVYRQYPLDAIHSNARPAAIASECAAEIGGNDSFWDFLSIGFEDPETNLTNTGLKSVAASIGLDADKFAECIDSGSQDEKVENQYQGGLAAGVNGTPGNFIINDKGEAWIIPGAVPLETLKQAIDLALESR